MRPDATKENTSFAELYIKQQKLVADLKRLVDNFTLSEGSALRRMIKNCAYFCARQELEFSGSPLGDSVDQRARIRDMAALAELIRSYSLIRTSRKLVKLRDHLSVLSNAVDFGQAYPISGSNDSRCVFELQIAMAALCAFGDVDLEPPGGDENKPHPDIIFPFDGTLFGIACKSVTTRNQPAWQAHFVKGINQIEKAKEDGFADLTSGVVLFDISRALPQDEFLPYDNGHFAFDEPEVLMTLNARVDEYIQCVLNKTEAENASRASPLRPSVMFFGDVTTITKEHGITSLKVLKHIRLVNDGANHPWFERLNIAIHQQAVPL